MKVKIGSDFPVDSSFPADRASLHFEERSGDTSNFHKTLHNFSTSSARWHQNIMPGNILTCWFYLQKFHSLFKPSAIFDHKRYFFWLIDHKNHNTLHPLIKVSAETDEYPSLRFQDTMKKPELRMDTLTDGQHENSIPLTNKVCGGAGGGGGGGYNNIYRIPILLD